MKITAMTTLLLTGLLSLSVNAAEETTTQQTAAAQNVGAPAGESATSYATGTSVVVGVSAVSALAALALAAQSNDSSSTGTTTTTTTSTTGR